MQLMWRNDAIGTEHGQFVPSFGADGPRLNARYVWLIFEIVGQNARHH